MNKIVLSLMIYASFGIGLNAVIGELGRGEYKGKPVEEPEAQNKPGKRPLPKTPTKSTPSDTGGKNNGPDLRDKKSPVIEAPPTPQVAAPRIDPVVMKQNIRQDIGKAITNLDELQQDAMIKIRILKNTNPQGALKEIEALIEKQKELRGSTITETLIAINLLPTNDPERTRLNTSIDAFDLAVQIQRANAVLEALPTKEGADMTEDDRNTIARLFGLLLQPFQDLLASLSGPTKDDQAIRNVTTESNEYFSRSPLLKNPDIVAELKSLPRMRNLLNTAIENKEIPSAQKMALKEFRDTLDDILALGHAI